ncbi:MAG: TlpA family protein disulfide reductase [Acidimicrobiia bacterium]
MTATILKIRSIPTVIALGPDGSELGRIGGVPRRADLENAVAALAHQSSQI